MESIQANQTTSPPPYEKSQADARGAPVVRENHAQPEPEQAHAQATGQAPQQKTSAGGWNTSPPAGLQEHATPLRNLREQPRWVHCPQSSSNVATETKYENGMATWICCCLICHIFCCLFCCLRPVGNPEYQDVHHRCRQCGDTIVVRPYDPIHPENVRVLRPDHEPIVQQQYGRQDVAMYAPPS